MQPAASRRMVFRLGVSGREEEKRMLDETGGRVTAPLGTDLERFASVWSRARHTAYGGDRCVSEKHLCRAAFDLLMMHGRRWATVQEVRQHREQQ